MLPRTDHWYSIVQTKLSDKEWYSNFRLSRETFSYVLSQISTEISHQDTKLRQALSSEKCLAIYLYYLGSTAEYRTVANLFGVSNAFVCLCVKEVSQAIFKKMKRRLLCLPKGDDLKNVTAMYRQRWGFPLCAGAIDGTHIAIQASIFSVMLSSDGWAASMTPGFCPIQTFTISAPNRNCLMTI